ncbi:MAG: D-alanyl-D-alanine carboxypeptidase family protein [Acidimicrobiia bacterium]|nr:D-alanyl-D-alanine carboxypeptidase family protein [Acidimicrobiia bacterium]
MTGGSIPQLRRALSGAMMFLVAVLAVTMPAGAQEDVEELEALKAEREQIQQEAGAQAVKVDAANADFSVLAQALDDINALVDLQEARLADANQAVRSAEAQVLSAELREAEIAEEVDLLQGEVADLAVASFTGESGQNGEDLTALLLSDDPSEAARRRSLVEFQTGSLSDGIDRLRSLIAEAEVVSEQRRVAVQAAIDGKVEAEARAQELELAMSDQLELVTAAELRLEARLAEAAVLEEQGDAKAAEIKRQEEVIARRIRQEAARRAAAIAAEKFKNRPPVATPDEITNVQGVYVHKDIASKVDEMLSAARSDGVDLSGWGYRSNLKQIELRQQHCGTSEFAVWEMAASACSPPTARPGQSMHERGLAIDFTYNGGSMTSRSNPGFVWLNNNAHRWGFVNLPSEPWHWSTTGA